jgi:hypothetical protein
MANIEMKYDGYPFIPVPIVTISKEFQKSNDNTLNGTLFNINLNGNLVAYPTGGLYSIIDKQNILRNSVKDEGKLFTLTCDGNILVSGYPRIASTIEFNESSNNWIFTCPYTLAFQFDDFLVYSGDTTGVAPPYISESTETWNVEFSEENSYYSFDLPDGSGKDTSPYQVRLSHTLSAVGKAHYDGSGLVKPAWEQARDHVISNLGYNSTYLSSSGILNLNVTGLAPFNYTRTNELDVRGGSFNCSENWLVINTGISGYNGNAIETFTANIQNSLDSSNISAISIEGTIQGLETRSYGTNPGDFNISQTKYSAASGYWSNVQSKIYSRAKLFGNGFADRAINPQTLSKVVGHNPSQGTINYTYQYDDRPSNCISGALRESFTVSDTNPNDIFASIVVLGRSAGPILQAIGTSGATTREINVDILMNPVTGCPTTAGAVTALMNSSPKAQVGVIIGAFKQELINSNTQVFVNQDNESWDWKSGKYTRNVSWTYTNACVG